MERTAWTDQRLDDLATRMDAGFERVDRDIRDLRAEMRRGFDAVNGRVDGVNGRFDAMEARFDARFDSLQTTMMRLGGAIIVCLLGVIAASSIGS
jgi:hypothetical protein